MANVGSRVLSSVLLQILNFKKYFVKEKIWKEEMSDKEYPIKKISAVGAGLISAQTGVKAHFTVYTGYIPGSKESASLPDPRPHLDFHIEGKTLEP